MAWPPAVSSAGSGVTLTSKVPLASGMGQGYSEEQREQENREKGPQNWRAIRTWSSLKAAEELPVRALLGHRCVGRGLARHRAHLHFELRMHRRGGVLLR